MIGIILNIMEELKYKTIKNVVSGRTTKKRAESILNLSPRQINRLIIKYKTCGKLGFAHGNRNKKSPRKIDDDISKLIIDLYTNNYYDFSINHFNEILQKKHNIKISYPTLKRILADAYIISIYAHKKTKIKMKKLIKLKGNNLNIDQNSIIRINAIIDKKDARPRKEKPKYEGEVIEMDACEHVWFGDTKTHLHGSIDVSTGKILGLYFDTQETLNGYYHITKQMILNYGIPARIKTDKRTVFEYTSKIKRDIEVDTFTQYGYMCNALGINLTCSSIPESKPHIERLWGTLQKRLIPLMREANICCISEANAFIQLYINTFNQQFSVHNHNNTNVYTKDSIVEKEIDKYLSVISFRIVDKGHSIKYKNDYYKFELDGKQEYIAPKLKVLVIKDFNGNLYSTIDGLKNFYELVKIKDFQEYSAEFDIDRQIEVKLKKTYRPPSNHPWKSGLFNKHLKNVSHINYSI